MNKNLKEQFLKYGYLHLKNVISMNEVNKCRAIFKELLERRKEKSIYPGQVDELLPRHNFLKSEIFLLPFKKKIVNTIKHIIDEEIYYLNDLHTQINMSGINKKKPYSGWHTDSGSEGEKEYLCSKNYRSAKICIYFQKNSKNWGGGINVLPKSHNFPLNIGSLKHKFYIKNKINNLKKFFCQKFLFINPGDVVIFDPRLEHTSSIGIKQNIDYGEYIGPFPHKAEKYVLYWNVCSFFSKTPFLKNSEKRAKKEKKQLFFLDYLRFLVPGDYIKSAIENKISLASISSKKQSFYISEFNKLSKTNIK